jgi:hypothetical protein
MITMVAQIEPVASVRSPVVSGEPRRQAPDSAPSYVAEQPVRDAAPVKEAPRYVPVANNDELRLIVDADTHEVIATLVDAQTHEVIRHIPGEETRRAAEVIRAVTGQNIDKVV